MVAPAAILALAIREKKSKLVPPVRVAVAVDVTLSCAAWRGAFQHVLVHRQDLGARKGKGEGKGSKNNLIKIRGRRKRQNHQVLDFLETRECEML